MLNTVNPPAKPQNYKTSVEIDWCPGCGDFGILNALVLAFEEMVEVLSRKKLKEREVLTYA